MPLRPSTTIVLVVDASVIAPVVADGGPDGDALRNRLRGETIAGPDLLRIEVMSVIRRQASTATLSDAQASRAVEDLLELPVAVYPVTPLLGRVWALRGNLSTYDACYVALAEALGCPLVTADRRLANAPGSRCPIEVL
jgi:predicted nucleic acid-binding protein